MAYRWVPLPEPQNIILSESEKHVVQDLQNSGVLKVYRRYVDNNRAAMKALNVLLFFKK